MSQEPQIKCLALLSGGLDSTLAVKLMLEQSIAVEAVNFVTVFCQCTRKSRVGCGSEAKRVSEELGVPLRIMNVSAEYLNVVRHPKFGRGSSMNPCIDCRIFMHKKAKELMLSIGARFIVTGEVLGQRPMSQHRRALELIDRESDLDELILRPLSAKHFPPTLPEREGWVDREKLLALEGRSRKPQMALANQFGIADYPCPAGGCLLTDKIFGARIKDLFTHQETVELQDMVMLKHGRHLRLSDSVKVIIGRDEVENAWLLSNRRDWALWHCKDHLGAAVLSSPSVPQELKPIIAGVAARYSKGKDETIVDVVCELNGHSEIVAAPPLTDSEIAEWRIE